MTITIKFSEEDLESLRSMRDFIEDNLDRQVNYKEAIQILCVATRGSVSGFDVKKLALEVKKEMKE
jgi:hypothetical protein